jgi:hypothetical protein
MITHNKSKADNPFEQIIFAEQQHGRPKASSKNQQDESKEAS